MAASKTKQRKKVLINETKRVGDEMVHVRVETAPAVVEFRDILKAVEVVPDEHCGEPWKEQDGLEHEFLPREEWLSGDLENAVGAVNGNDGCILISRKQMEAWGVAASARARGASKQVAFELAAENRRKTIEQLLQWYDGGESYWWCVRCKFLDERASQGGIDDYDYADSEACREIAEQIADALEEKGYTVIGRPGPDPKEYLVRLRVALNLGFDSSSAYQLWLSKDKI